MCACVDRMVKLSIHESCRSTDLQNQVAHACLQLHGGWGYMFEVPIARAFTDARIQALWGGTNEIMKEIISRRIVK